MINIFMNIRYDDAVRSQGDLIYGPVKAKRPVGRSLGADKIHPLLIGRCRGQAPDLRGVVYNTRPGARMVRGR